MNVLITGGCGYVGTVLVENLLADGYSITVIDTQWFGNYLKPHHNLKILKQDIRDLSSISFDGFESIIHLANIANDPAVELLPSLSWEVNVLAAQKICEKAVIAGVRQIIYASSGSVYGVKDDPEVTEELSLVPISTYNKTKMVAERVFLSYRDKLQVHCVRPATVCGWSSRMRLDVSVNMLTFQALQNQKITVYGGSQTRPNLHILDMVRVYQHFLRKFDLESGFYNAGFENISILEIASMVRKKIPCEIIVSDSIDPRSYRQNSDKLIKTGFHPRYCVNNAIDDIAHKFKDGNLKDLDSFYTVKWMKSLALS